MTPDDAPAPPTDTPFRCARRVTSDADDHAQGLRAWDQRYEQRSRGRFTGILTDAWLDGIQVFRERTDQSTYQAGRCWPEARVFGVVLDMAGTGAFCDHPLPRMGAFAFDAAQAFSMRTPREFDVVGIALCQRRLRAHCESTGETALMGGCDVRLFEGTAALDALRTRLREFFLVMEQSPRVFDAPGAQRELVSTLLGALGAVTSGPDAPPVARPALRSRARLVERAREHVLARPAAPPTVAELCAALGVSRRTLQYCFRDVLGLSPAQFLRSVRLNGVRRDLRRGEGASRVGDLAARWGFWHLSQFAADYRAQFGELPSETARRSA